MDANVRSLSPIEISRTVGILCKKLRIYCEFVTRIRQYACRLFRYSFGVSSKEDLTLTNTS